MLIHRDGSVFICGVEAASRVGQSNHMGEEARVRLS